MAALRGMLATLLLVRVGALRSRTTPAPSSRPFAVSPSEASRFVSAIGGEKVLSDVLDNIRAREDLFEEEKTVFLEALKIMRTRQRDVGFGDKYMVMQNMDVLEALLVDHAGIAICDWLVSSEGEEAIMRTVGISREEYSMLRSVVFHLAPKDWGYANTHGFDFAPGPWDAEDTESMRIAAELVALFASQVGKFLLYCIPENAVTEIRAFRNTSGGRSTFGVKFMGTDAVFPSLQPWVVHGADLHFFGKMRQDLTSYAVDFFLPLLAWMRMPNREEGRLPGAVTFKFELWHGDPVVRVAKVRYRRDGAIGLEPWCAGATRMEVLKMFAMFMAKEITMSGPMVTSSHTRSDVGVV